MIVNNAGVTQKYLPVLIIVAVAVLLLSSILHLLSGAFTLVPWDLNELEHIIFWQLRVPRLILALLAGAALGCSGAALQLLLRNGLAEPGILGIGNAAAVTTVGALYFGLVAPTSWLLPVIGFVGAMSGLVLLLWLSRRDLGAHSVILAGVAIAAFSGAGLALILHLAPNPFAYQEWSLWLLGSFANRSWEHVALFLPGVVIGFALLLRSRHFINALILGEETVATLGYHLLRRRTLVLLALALISGSAVVAVGVIGFIGLIAPHALRLAGIHHPTSVLFGSGLIGAVLVVVCDLVALNLPTQNELQVGVITALLGAPLFILLLYRRQQSNAQSGRG